MGVFQLERLRYNWNTPIYASPTQKATLYIGAQVLFRSRDRGDSWERISPDLTSNDPEKQKQEESGGVTVDNSSAEEHTTIYSISESRFDPNTIWVEARFADRVDGRVLFDLRIALRPEYHLGGHRRRQPPDGIRVEARFAD